MGICLHGWRCCEDMRKFLRRSKQVTGIEMSFYLDQAAVCFLRF